MSNVFALVCVIGESDPLWSASCTRVVLVVVTTEVLFTALSRPSVLEVAEQGGESSSIALPTPSIENTMDGIRLLCGIGDKAPGGFGSFTFIE